MCNFFARLYVQCQDIEYLKRNRTEKEFTKLSDEEKFSIHLDKIVEEFTQYKDVRTTNFISIVNPAIQNAEYYLNAISMDFIHEFPSLFTDIQNAQ